MDCQFGEVKPDRRPHSLFTGLHLHANDPLFLCHLRDGSQRKQRDTHGCGRVSFLRAPCPRAKACGCPRASDWLRARLPTGGSRRGGEISLHLLPESARCRCTMGRPRRDLPGVRRQDAGPPLVGRSGMAAHSGSSQGKIGTRHREAQCRGDRLSQSAGTHQPGSGHLADDGQNLSPTRSQ